MNEANDKHHITVLGSDLLAIETAKIIEEKKELLKDVSKFAQKQVERTRTTESSPKNTTLYFSILTESKDLIKATMAMLELYNDQYDSSIEPPTNGE